MKNLLKSKKIAVLCGGSSGERDVSIRSGANVYNSLKKQGFNVIKMDTESDLITRLQKNKVDIVYIMLHGKGGEDGTIQGLLEIAGIPYTGSGVLASALGMNKIASKRIFEAVGIPTPKYYHIDPDNTQEDIARIGRSFPFPVVIKPVSEGSSLGVAIIKKRQALALALKKTISKFKDVFVEEFVPGAEVTVGILGTGSKAEALPILELAPKNEFYDFEAKYTAGKTEFILPARLPKILYKHTQEMALKAHRALSCRGFSRVDIIISKHDHVPYVHEINTIPGMTDQSDLPAEAKQAGITFDQLVVKILESAM